MPLELSDCDLLADENVHLKVVQFLRMQAYIEWLSEETGRNHRLPTEKEIGSIQKLADASENNLDYWAGYAPTPDERQALEAHPDGTAEGASAAPRL